MQSKTRPQVALPKHMHVEEHGERTTLSWRWFTRDTVILVVCCALLNGTLLLVHSGMGPFDLLLCTLPSGLFTYVSLTGLLNRTHLEVSRGVLRIQHGPLPLPWFGKNRTVSGSELTQLYGQEMRSSKGKITYSLFAIDKEGRKVELVWFLEHKDQMLYLVQTLERLLVIEDRPVEGEVAQRNQVA